MPRDISSGTTRHPKARDSSRTGWCKSPTATSYISPDTKGERPAADSWRSTRWAGRSTSWLESARRSAPSTTRCRSSPTGGSCISPATSSGKATATRCTRKRETRSASGTRRPARTRSSGTSSITSRRPTGPNRTPTDGFPDSPSGADATATAPCRTGVTPTPSPWRRTAASSSASDTSTR